MTDQASAAVADHLNRILGSATFAGAARISRFLEFVVTEALSGRQKYLKAYTIALEVLGRDVDFDPNNDSIVRVEAGRLRDRLARYYYSEGGDDRVRIEIPRGGYAPVFSFSDENLEAPAVTSTATPIAQPDLSIGVLPFANMSGDPSQKYFCDGVVEEITTTLLKFPNLRVAARSALANFKPSEIDVRSLAAELNLRFVLEGSVRRQADQVRIFAKLINTADGASVWARIYERNVTASNLFEIEDDVAYNVAAAIAAPSGAIASFELESRKRRAPTTFSAYDAVLTAYDDMKHPNPGNHAHILELLEQAVRDEPSYGEAWALLASYLLSRRRYDPHARGDTSLLDRALAAARRGVAESHSNALAWRSLATVHYERFELDLFEEACERVITLNPAHADAIAEIGGTMWMGGNRERGVELVEYALSLNPQAPGWYYFTIVHEHYLSGRYNEALAAALKLNTPEMFWQHVLKAAIYGKLGRLDDAKSAADKFLTQFPGLIDQVSTAADHRPHPPGFLGAVLDGLSAAGLPAPKDA